jgi:hypothetical protein
MTSINAYLAALKNVSPKHLDAALEEAPITSDVQREILAHVWIAQREETKETLKASELSFLLEEAFDEGLWFQFFDLEGRLTDAFRDSVGIVEQQRVTVVVDGKIKHLNPDDEVTLFKAPIEPDEI